MKSKPLIFIREVLPTSIQRLVIDFKLPSLNEYINICRRNRYAANNFKIDIEDKIYYIIKQQRLKPITSPVRLNFKWYEATRRRDKDNVCSSKKYILDALQTAQILPNDSNKWVKGLSDEFIYGAGQGVAVEITEVL